MFFDRFEDLCRKKGVARSRAATDAGFNKSTVDYWKNHEDAKPSAEIAEKICSYFGITMSELYGEETKKAPAKQEPSDEDIMRALWGDISGMDKKDLEDVKRYAAFVKERKNNK